MQRLPMPRGSAPAVGLLKFVLGAKAGARRLHWPRRALVRLVGGATRAALAEVRRVGSCVGRGWEAAWPAAAAHARAL